MGKLNVERFITEADSDSVKLPAKSVCSIIGFSERVTGTVGSVFLSSCKIKAPEWEIGKVLSRFKVHNSAMLLQLSSEIPEISAAIV